MYIFILIYIYISILLHIYIYIYMCVDLYVYIYIYIYIQNHVLSRGHVVVVMVEKCISRYGLRALLGTIEFPPVDWDLVHFNTTR